MSIRRSILLRVRIAFLLATLFALLLVFYLFRIQVVEGEQWLAKAKEVNVQYRAVKAVRGNIYADDGSLLATSLPHYRVAFDPTIASPSLYDKNIDSLSLLLSEHFGNLSPEAYHRKIQQGAKQAAALPDAQTAKR